jgi:hypothetical protein
MFKVSWFKRDVTIQLTKRLGDWEINNRTPEDFWTGLDLDIRKAVLEKVLKGLEYEIDVKAKDMLYEILEEDDFKTGLNRAIKDNFKSKFTDYLERM